jgi:hypothetical protein
LAGIEQGEKFPVRLAIEEEAALIEDRVLGLTPRAVPA